MKLGELADLTGGKISGNPEVEITGVSVIKEARQGDIALLADKKNLGDMASSNASAVIVKEELKDLTISMLITENPFFAFARALEVFYIKPFKSTGVSDKAVVGRNVTLGHDVSIHPLAFIGDNVVLGSRVTVSPGSYVGEGVSIGDDSFIHANVTIKDNVKIGKKVIIHSGTVIGCDGFGYVMEKGRHYKIPQVGRVIIENEVEIGANVAIDRATIGDTVIGHGTKIDNLVQIAHNVKIGQNCIIVSQVGISGSVEIGNGAILAGQVGVRDHIKIGSGAKVGAQSGIGNDIPDGQIYSGSPAIPHGIWLRAQKAYSKLPEYVRRLRELERKVKDISGKNQNV
jgi:UDP-3-O-[3-hydroxymyristoyl] glucosamine N-acyltransferase